MAFDILLNMQTLRQRSHTLGSNVVFVAHSTLGYPRAVLSLEQRLTFLLLLLTPMGQNTVETLYRCWNEDEVSRASPEVSLKREILLSLGGIASCSASNSACSYTFLRSVLCRLSSVTSSMDSDAIWQLHLWGPRTLFRI